ncbi:hypothetical protein SIAM614_03623 [Stappia aggregata IAM 12614]|uniref:Uncharacterized protein n=1 Tax=Roseibium aggregatum (strain ATCC 25650 / DSM 13394 / JCM 20685 / NBRC 16684 / NCIMB 2208 / IAM 12614 / B1) TaxID=384765 RepID=A0P3T1_ROSAI|nr:hypothetical protein SIAM614_03623 [Stappia aggregata IAM 12614] [Roseibium aggregatum IAM 12614]
MVMQLKLPFLRGRAMFSSSTIVFVKLRDPIDFRRRRYAAAGNSKANSQTLGESRKTGRKGLRNGILE